MTLKEVLEQALRDAQQKLRHLQERYEAHPYNYYKIEIDQLKRYTREVETHIQVLQNEKDGYHG